MLPRVGTFVHPKSSTFRSDGVIFRQGLSSEHLRTFRALWYEDLVVSCGPVGWLYDFVSRN